MNVFSVIKNFYWKKIASPLAYAKHIGVNIGLNNLISKDHWSSEPYLITVGSNCQITHGVLIHTHGGCQAVRDLFPDFDVFGKVIIGDYVYIGCNSQIMPGVTIGDNVLVAAGSIVTKSIPSGYVVAGNPAKIICSIEQYLEKNQIFDLHSKHLNDKEKKKIIESSESKMIIKAEMRQN